MRDCYVGDIGDFANNALLRMLCGTPQDPVLGMRLGIIWYRSVGEDKHGNAIGYLNPSEHNRSTYRECDRELYDELQRLVGGRMAENQNRLIEDIINSPILRPDTQHYAIPIPAPATRANRKQWFSDAMDQTAESDVIFLNPDTGIDWDGRTRPQYVDPWEINKLSERGNIVIVYQHQQRDDWINRNARDLLGDTLTVQHLWVCTWNRVSKRAYFIAAQTQVQRARIEKRLSILRQSQWVRMRHITLAGHLNGLYRHYYH